MALDAKLERFLFLVQTLVCIENTAKRHKREGGESR